jgi:hypothetical protein
MMFRKRVVATRMRHQIGVARCEGPAVGNCCCGARSIADLWQDSLQNRGAADRGRVYGCECTISSSILVK